MRTLTITVPTSKTAPGFDLWVNDMHIGWTHAPEVVAWLRKELEHAIGPSKGSARHPWHPSQQR